MTESRRRPIRWLIAAVIALVIVPALAFGNQAGECVDYAADAGVDSYCTSGPAIGYPGAWVLTVAALLFAGYAVWRGFRSSSR
jgi:hypothetical protein